MAQNVINTDYSLNGLDFKISDQQYRIVRSQSNNRIHETIDEVKNVKSGKLKEYTREKLKQVLIKNNATLVVIEVKQVRKRR